MIRKPSTLEDKLMALLIDQLDSVISSLKGDESDVSEATGMLVNMWQSVNYAAGAARAINEMYLRLLAIQNVDLIPDMLSASQRQFHDKGYDETVLGLRMAAGRATPSSVIVDLAVSLASLGKTVKRAA